GGGCGAGLRPDGRGEGGGGERGRHAPRVEERIDSRRDHRGHRARVPPRRHRRGRSRFRVAGRGLPRRRCHQQPGLPGRAGGGRVALLQFRRREPGRGSAVRVAGSTDLLQLEDATGIVTPRAAAVAVGAPMQGADERWQSPSDLRRAIRALLRRPPAVFGLLCSIVVIVWALVPGLFAPMDPLEQNLERYLKPPGYVDMLGKTYWLGTDQQGRDVLSRVIWGSRISLIVGVTTVVVSGLIGVFLGIWAGYKGGWIDAVISRIIDTLFAVPFILLAMSLVAILGPSLQNMILAIALRTWIIYARVVRGEALSLRTQE